MTVQETLPVQKFNRTQLGLLRSEYMSVYIYNIHDHSWLYSDIIYILWTPLSVDPGTGAPLALNLDPALLLGSKSATTESMSKGCVSVRKLSRHTLYKSSWAKNLREMDQGTKHAVQLVRSDLLRCRTAQTRQMFSYGWRLYHGLIESIFWHNIYLWVSFLMPPVWG